VGNQGWRKGRRKSQETPDCWRNKKRRNKKMKALNTGEKTNKSFKTLKGKNKMKKITLLLMSFMIIQLFICSVESRAQSSFYTIDKVYSLAVYPANLEIVGHSLEKICNGPYHYTVLLSVLVKNVGGNSGILPQSSKIDAYAYVSNYGYPDFNYLFILYDTAPYPLTWQTVKLSFIIDIPLWGAYYNYFTTLYPRIDVKVRGSVTEYDLSLNDKTFFLNANEIKACAKS